jgi:L-lactate dehydrogenase complex protein LldF
VKIPLSDLMRKLRERQFGQGLKPKMETWGLAAWRWAAQRPAIYAMLTKIAARVLAVMGSSDRLIHKLPFSDGWTHGRDMPAPTGPKGKTFRELYQASRSIK